MSVEEEYLKMSKEDIKDLKYTGNWELDKKRFTREFEKNLEVLTKPFNIEDIYSEEDI